MGVGAGGYCGGVLTAAEEEVGVCCCAGWVDVVLVLQLGRERIGSTVVRVRLPEWIAYYEERDVEFICVG